MKLSARPNLRLSILALGLLALGVFGPTACGDGKNATSDAATSDEATSEGSSMTGSASEATEGDSSSEGASSSETSPDASGATENTGEAENAAPGVAATDVDEANTDADSGDDAGSQGAEPDVEQTATDTGGSDVSESDPPTDSADTSGELDGGSDAPAMQQSDGGVGDGDLACSPIGGSCAALDCCDGLSCDESVDRCTQSRPAALPEVCALGIDPGPCRAAIVAYAFDAEAGRCEEFIYGGCEGNDNRFETLEACQSTCECDDCTSAGGTDPAQEVGCALGYEECITVGCCAGLICNGESSTCLPADSP